MSASRQRILELLRDQPEPVTQAALTRATGLHANTVRDHLDALVRAGLVRRATAEPSGRGRPAWLYECTAAPATSEYAGLAAALAATLAATSAQPGEDSAAAGRAWGHELVAERGLAATDPADARAQVIALMEDLDFAPRPDADVEGLIHLTQCPLLAAAHRHPEVVCGVHLGVVRGALEALGADPNGSDLVPFAQPGSCHLVLPPPRALG